MGSVYLADSPEGRTVALKVIRADLAEEPEFRRRFRSEVARAQEVPPFCTAEVLDADPDHETPFLVVEFVDGPSLAEVVLDRGPLTPANLYGLAIGVATALTAIHGAGVIHRDLKPSNVLLAPGTPKVIDFGIARGTERSDGDTRTDQLIGTVAYMAPERLDPSVGSTRTAPGHRGREAPAPDAGRGRVRLGRGGRVRRHRPGAVPRRLVAGDRGRDPHPGAGPRRPHRPAARSGGAGAVEAARRPADRPAAARPSAARPATTRPASDATEASLVKGMQRAYVAATQEMPRVEDDRSGPSMTPTTRYPRRRGGVR